jgi:hypothetical protein
MNASDLSSLLPTQGNEWSMTDDHYYNNETLFDYIDGAAELYLSYGFDTVISRTYACAGEMDIVAEVFDMHAARDAFGAFTNMREKNQNEFGQGSQQIEGSLIFWKDHYFISVSTNKTTGKSVAAIRAIAASIDKAIVATGTVPPVLHMLPQEGLVPEGYCYFHHYIWLNSYYFIANYNILDVADSTNAVVAKYGPADKRVYLLLVQYPDEKKASAAFDKFKNDFAPELKPGNAIQLKDKTWHTASLQGDVFMAVFNASDRNKALNLIKATEQKLLLKPER